VATQTHSSHGDLNGRQLELVFYALRHPESEFTTTSHQRAQAVDYNTARSDLTELVDRGFLQRRQIGRGYVYYPAKNLDQRLAGLV
jgi:Fic family protein